MNKFKRKLFNLAGKLLAAMPDDTSQTSVAPGSDLNYDKPGVSALCRQAASEGAVLLKNNGSLPLTKDDGVALFSRLQFDWFFTGYGSGGDVNAPYTVNLFDGLKNHGVNLNMTLAEKYRGYVKKHPADKGVWAHWPTNLEEMRITPAEAERYSAESNKAIVIIGRSSGEDMDNRLEEGNWYLTKEEKHLLDAVTSAFSKVILLINSANIIDMSVIASYGDKIDAIMYVWEGGMESGNAVADVLLGRSPVCGKLTDTIAVNYEAYPTAGSFGNKDYNEYTEDIYVGYRYFETFAKDSVLWPFGFGLSYTEFSVENAKARKNSDTVSVSCTVTNTGKMPGKETVQVYSRAPQGRLGKPERALVGFRKTALLNPGEREEIEIEIDISSFASYDDEETYSYILEKGVYGIYLGTDVRSAEKISEFKIEEDTVIEKLSQCAAPAVPFRRLKNKDGKPSYEPVPVTKVNLKEKILSELPVINAEAAQNASLKDVKEGKITLDSFVASLSNDELEAISRGDYTMNSPLGNPGNAGALGGVLPSLRDKGVPPVIFTDGPSGIRIGNIATLIPIGTCLACAFNPELVEILCAEIGKEMTALGSMVICAPGMNIHRDPLCGRNFEYFSEDPLVTGLNAAAMIRGIQSAGVSACPKHFACNNQEKNRVHNDSRVSERALREIYLKGFETAVRTASPNTIMTSYNKINGVWGHYHYELVHDILRGEWGFDGCVVTDWWMRSSASPEFPSLRDQAYRVRSGVNVLMPGGARTGKKVPDGTLLETLGRPDGITIGELRQNAKEILGLAIKYI